MQERTLAIILAAERLNVIQKQLFGNSGPGLTPAIARERLELAGPDFPRWCYAMEDFDRALNSL